MRYCMVIVVFFFGFKVRVLGLVLADINVVLFVLIFFFQFEVLQFGLFRFVLKLVFLRFLFFIFYLLRFRFLFLMMIIFFLVRVLVWFLCFIRCCFVNFRNYWFVYLDYKVCLYFCRYFVRLRRLIFFKWCGFSFSS